MSRKYPAKKIAYTSRTNKLFDDYDKIMMVGADNVTSAQLHNVRRDLRGLAVVLFGKNTLLKKILTDRVQESGSDRDKQLHQKLVVEKMIQGNVGLIFTNGDLKDVKKAIEGNRVQAPARQGTVAPVDVTVPAGNTFLEPTKTSFFQALNIPTKITKGCVEMLKDETIIKAGDKVGSSEATLLQMLSIKPFFYGLTVEGIYDNGSVYGVDVLEMTDEIMEKKVQAGIAVITALSLGLSWPTQASFPHLMMNGFKNILAVSVATDYDFEEFNGKDLKDGILNGPAPGTVAAAPVAAAAAVEEKKVEEEEEEDDDMGFGLFD